MIEEHLDDSDVTPGRGQRQRRVVGHVAVFVVCVRHQQQLDDFLTTAGTREGQCGVLGAFRLCLDVGAVVEKDVTRARVACGCSED